jgi:hypothetical protein
VSFSLAYNGSGIAAGGGFYNVQPGTATWFCLKAEGNILLLGVVRCPETEAQ